MAFLKRVFSGDYRRALAAEAAGEYLEAARAYALAGEREKVAEMHLLAAERAPAPDVRLASLRTAVRWSDGGTDAARAVRRRIARAMLDHVRAGIVGDTERALLREAAALFDEANDPAGAGECLEIVGDEVSAADAYQRAGDVERLEAVLEREESRRHVDGEKRERFEQAQILLATGERDRALELLRAVVAVDPGGAARDLVATLERKRIASGRVALRVAPVSAPTLYVGAFPFAFGREVGAEVLLRDSNVSRRHAEVLARDGRFFVRDLRSRNGTLLDGVAIDGELPLEGDGELGIGTHCAIAFRAGEGALALTVVRGLDRGLEVRASPGSQSIAGGAATLSFDSGRPLIAPSDGWTLRLDGTRAPSAQLVRGDVVELSARSGEVVRVDVVE